MTPLGLGAVNKVPTAIAAIDDDADSSYFTFTGNRAHFTGEVCSATSDCQSGERCTAGLCQ